MERSRLPWPWEPQEGGGDKGSGTAEAGASAIKPGVQIGVFDDNGQIGKLEQSAVVVSGTSSNAAGGTVVLVITDKNGTTVDRQTVALAQDGTWSTTVDVSGAPDGSLKATAVAFNRDQLQSAEASKDAVKDTLIDADIVGFDEMGGFGAGTDWSAHLDPDSDTGIKGDGITAHNRPSFSGTGEPGGTVVITLPDGTMAQAVVGATGQWMLPYPRSVPALSNGTYALPIKASDLAGNSTSATLAVSIDGPTVRIVSFDGSQTSLPSYINAAEQATVTLSGTTTSAPAGSTVNISISGSSGSPVLVSATELANGTWSVTNVNLSSLPQGTLSASATVVATIEGVAVTSRAATGSAVKDTLIDPDPIAASTPSDASDFTTQLDPASDTATQGDSRTSQNRPVFSGKGEPGGTVQIRLPDGTVSSATVKADGTWSMPFPSAAAALSIGAQELPVLVTDPAGNSSSGVLPLTIVPGVEIGVFDGSQTAPPGFINAAEQGAVKVSGTTSPVVSGTVLLVITDKGGQEVARQTVVVAQDGSWTTTVDLSAPSEGVLTATAVATTTVNGVAVSSAAATRTAVKDTTADQDIVITHNASDLDGASTLPGSKADNKLNIAETLDGVTYTIRFNKPVQSLVASDLTITGAQLRGGPVSSADKTVWTVVVDPLAANNGRLDVTLNSQKLTSFVDPAGNPAGLTVAASVPYDTLVVAPVLVDNKNAGNDILVGGKAVFILEPPDLLSQYRINLPSELSEPLVFDSFSFRQGGSVSVNSQSIVVDSTVLNKLAQGLYTIEGRVSDEAGNTAVFQQVIGKTTGSLGRFVGVDQDDLAQGTGVDNYFINQRGLHETFDLDGSGDNDKVYFLKTGLGTPSAADQATITNFTPDKDQIVLTDILSSRGAEFLRFEAVNLNGNAATLESTKLYISSTGGFSPNDTPAAWQSKADQVVYIRDFVHDTSSTVPPAWLVI